MFKTRLMSSIVLVILTIAVLYFGGWVTALALLLLSLKGVQELLRVYKLDKSSFGILAYIFTVILYVIIYLEKNQFIMPLIVVYLLFTLACYVFRYPKHSDKDMSMAFIAFIYVSVMLSYIYRIRIMDDGRLLVCLIYVSSWGNDMWAYVAGITFGKHKMSPKVSPNKSIEGAIGGILGAGMFGALFGLLFSKYGVDSALAAVGNNPLVFTIIAFAVIGAIGALPAIVGDLAASAIKRNNEVKDYGRLIPGHGGVLDRFDSIIFTAPIVYYLIMMVNILS